MKLTPASRALAMIRCAVASSVGPPNIMVPRQSGDTFNPLRPSERDSIVAVSVKRLIRSGRNRRLVHPGRFEQRPAVDRGNADRDTFLVALHHQRHPRAG